MLKHLRFQIFEIQGAKLPVRLVNTTIEQRLVQGHETTPLRVKVDIEGISSELDSWGKGLLFLWMKRPEFYCSCVQPIGSANKECSTGLFAMKEDDDKCLDAKTNLFLKKFESPEVRGETWTDLERPEERGGDFGEQKLSEIGFGVRRRFSRRKERP
ncbi:hypothetical protein TNCV_4405191 [Trichonephila clavipes]|uniref:Uncharacterized protein n=1 Tax=Trichonephila clavipes TaxID=2585209 RepID=A0A8X6S1P2_TRICX|nr:hypothetical protein TNCV_4405191 [Trichonephila clavipes]